MMSWIVVLLNQHDDAPGGQSQAQLQQSCSAEAAEPCADHGAGGNAAPDSAAQQAQRAGTAIYSGHFHYPCGGARIQARLTHSLKDAAHVRTGDADGRQVGTAGCSTRDQPGEKADLPAAPVREWA